MITNAISFDVEDWFHIIGLDSIASPKVWETLSSIVVERTDWFLEELNRRDVRVTFFILGWIADRYPALVRRIAESGHEIGSHTYCGIRRSISLLLTASVKTCENRFARSRKRRVCASDGSVPLRTPFVQAVNGPSR